ncbi:MAG: general secretion pathway protein GspL [Burkholderiales bacterium]|nr:MAG: general secretion pathway protein GspL [Burkholderiales bacterium]
MLILAPANLSITDPPGRDAAVDWVRSSDGLMVLSHGQSEAASTLPPDKDVVLVVPPRALSWHRVEVPKVGQARWRAVLEGLLEDRLLDDVEELHFAAEPGKRPGQMMWVAVCRKPWLSAWLQALEAAGRPVSRIAPLLWPLPSTTGQDQASGNALDTSPSLHWAHEEGNTAWLTSASPAGVSCLPLQTANGTTAQALLGALMPGTDLDPFSAADQPQGARWMADPAVASMAEGILGQRFELVTRDDWMLQAAASEWNLAQFSFALSARARHGQRWRSLWRRWRTAPAWRPARWGLAALVLVQLAGLNAAAWLEHRSLRAKEAQVQALVRQSFPQVTLVLDAPAQMRREVQRLQQASGALGPGDLETQLSAVGQAIGAARSWPTRVQFGSGQTQLGAWQVSDIPPERIAGSLQSSGWLARWDGDAISLRPAGANP